MVALKENSKHAGGEGDGRRVFPRKRRYLAAPRWPDSGKMLNISHLHFGSNAAAGANGADCNYLPSGLPENRH